MMLHATNADLINATFEFLGALVCWRNAYQLLKDRAVKGVYWPMFSFFAVWGIWNLVYYASLNQPLSLIAGSLLCLGNITWVVGAIALRRSHARLQRRSTAR